MLGPQFVFFHCQRILNFLVPRRVRVRFPGPWCIQRSSLAALMDHCNLILGFTLRHTMLDVGRATPTGCRSGPDAPCCPRVPPLLLVFLMRISVHVVVIRYHQTQWVMNSEFRGSAKETKLRLITNWIWENTTTTPKSHKSSWCGQCAFIAHLEPKYGEPRTWKRAGGVFTYVKEWRYSPYLSSMLV